MRGHGCAMTRAFENLIHSFAVCGCALAMIFA